MRLYVNGDSHTAAAEAVNTYAFAEDDPALFYMGRAPHPDNLAVSWCRKVSDALKSVLHCDAESASSNQRIMRTTREWIKENQPWLSETVMIIQWSTWERQEWLIDGTYYQINASGIDDVPASHQEQYKQFVATVDWNKVTEQAHNDIWDFHVELQELGIKHVFFNGNNHFGDIAVEQRKDWLNCYIKPYDPKSTYSQLLLSNGFDTVAPNSWHFGKNAHRFWGRFMLQYCIDNQLMA